MKTTLLAALILLQSQDETSARVYLEKLSKAWASKPPEELTLGCYVGSKWVGSSKFSVKAAPADSGAAWEATVAVDFAFGEKKQKQRSTRRFSGALELVSAEGESSKGEKIEKTKLTVAAGQWVLVTEGGGETKTERGSATPGLIDDDALPFFLFYALPEGTADFTAVGKSKRHSFRRAEEKRKLNLGGKEIDCSVSEWIAGEKDKSVLFVHQGQVVQILAGGGTVRLRPVKPADIGKDLAEKEAVSPPARVVLDLFIAIKKLDKETIENLFDWERLPGEMVPKWETFTDEQKKKAEKVLHDRIIEDYTNGKVAKTLPPVEDIEPMFGPTLKVTEEDGKAVVSMPGAVFRVYQADAGDKKGKWLIYSISK